MTIRAGGLALELQQSQDRLRLALAAGRLGTWRWDMATGTVEWDAKLEQIFGFEPGGFDGTYETYMGRLHPEEREHTRAQVQRALVERSAYTLEHRIVWPDGTVRWIQGMGDVTVDEDGTPTGTIGCVADITHRIRAEQEREAAAERIRIIADALQSGLAPSTPPDVPGLRVATRYTAAGEGVQVGGDFHDLVAAPDGRWLLVVGDVCGRGPSAASLHAQVRFGARALVRAGFEVTAIAAGVNRELVIDSDVDRFCTAVFAMITPGDPTTVEIISAGHPHPILVRAGGVVEVLERTSPLLGIMPAAVFEAETIRLDTDDSLVVVTDGVLEARGAGAADRYEEPRLVALVASLAGAPAEEIAGAIERSVAAFAGAPLSDDLAVVVIQPVAIA